MYRINVVISKITPIREEMSKLMDDKNFLQEILNTGSLEAKKIASKTLYDVYDAMGLNS